ncbi:MAG: hypothetical protein ACTSU5_08865 [Promethearchaeota archaeon]
MEGKDPKRPKINISDEDIERAIRDAESCRKLFAKKSREEVFRDLLRLTAV